MSKQLRVLLVEDSENDALLLLRELEKGGYEISQERVETAPAMKKALADKSWDIVISDYNMPQFSALLALDVLKESALDLPFIVVSGKIGEDIAVKAMKAGAHDYLMKGNLSRLVPAIERELREAEERSIRRKAEQDIRQGKMEWEAVFDSVSDLIVLTDASGRIVRSNQRLIKHFRCTYAQVIGVDIAELFYGAPVPLPNRFSMAEPHNPHMEMEDIHFPALKGWFTVSSYSILNPANRLPRIVHIIKDVTKRKRMEEEKRVNDRELLTLYAVAFRLNSKRGMEKIMEDLLFQLHNMLQIDFSCIHILDGKQNALLKAFLGLSDRFSGNVRRLSNKEPWVERLLAGKTLKTRDMLRQMPAELVSSAREMGMRGWCAVPLKIGDEKIGMLMVGHRLNKEFSTREVFLLNSIANQLAVLIENHTLYEEMKEKTLELEKSKNRLKENLQAVKKANIELGRLNAAKNTFIGMASHELKTPLTSIMGGLQFLLKYTELNLSPEQLAMLTSVYEGVTDLRKLVENLLSISRIEASGVALQKKEFIPLSACRDVLESFTLPLSRRRIQVDIHGEDAPICADEDFFRLVVRNLLENAIKFTPDGGEITISAYRMEKAELAPFLPEMKLFYPNLSSNFKGINRFYRLDIMDTGVGIPPEERTRVFEKFYGVGDIAYHSSGKTDFMSKGTGLGLSIVKGIMDAHNGLVWIGPGAGGCGTVFSLLFPLE